MIFLCFSVFIKALVLHCSHDIKSTPVKRDVRLKKNGLVITNRIQKKHNFVLLQKMCFRLQCRQAP